jgi:hypothetical protein
LKSDTLNCMDKQRIRVNQFDKNIK